MQIGVGRMAAPAAAGVVLEITDTLEDRPVVVDRAGNPRLLRRGDETFRQRIAILVTRDVHRSVAPAERGIAMRVLLHALEIRQHALQAPPGVAEAFPV